MAISSPAQYCGLRLRRATRQLPEEREVLRRCEAPGRLGARDFLKLLKAKRKVPGAAERQKDPGRAGADSRARDPGQHAEDIVRILEPQFACSRASSQF